MATLWQLHGVCRVFTYLLVVSLLGIAHGQEEKNTLEKLRAPFNADMNGMFGGLESNSEQSDGLSSGPNESMMARISSSAFVSSRKFGQWWSGTRTKALTEWPIQMKGLEGADPEIGHYAGYYKLNRTHDARLFYFFFESRAKKETDPLVLWMTGGPGCSSELAVFYENGPFHINSDNLTLSWNPNGWDQVANMIYIDQPVNTGFSYSDDKRDDVRDEHGVSTDVYMFLQEFLEEHPELRKRDFYVTGESYGGHYVPAVAGLIHRENKRGQKPPISLKGFAIGNGLTDPSIQYTAYPDFALQNNLIGQDVYETYMNQLPICLIAIEACGTRGVISCYTAYYLCNILVQKLLKAAGNINVYDVRQQCTYAPLCYDFSQMDQYLAQPQVRKSLGVGNREFVECSDRVYKLFMRDFMRNLEPGIPEMLEDGVRVLIYAGEYDFICNWIGNSRWVEQMSWSGHDAFVEAPWLTFRAGCMEKGLARESGNLSFLKMYNAGHMVPMDQPEASLEMFKRWLAKEPLAGRTERDISMLAQ